MAREYTHDASWRPLEWILPACQDPRTSHSHAHILPHPASSFPFHSLPSPIPFSSFFSQVIASLGNLILICCKGRFGSLPHILGQNPFGLLHVGVGCMASSSPPSHLSCSLCMSRPFPPQVLPTAGPGTRIRCLQFGPLSHQNFATCHER